MAFRIEGEGTVRVNSLGTVNTNSTPLQTQQYQNHVGANSVIGQMNQQASMVKLGVTRQAPAAQPIPPSDALKKINELPVPEYSDTPRQLPQEERDAIHQGALKDYNNKRAEIADKAIQNSQPPKPEDFDDLPPQAKNAQYQQAVESYNRQIAELKKISREAKQVNLEATEQFKTLSPENQELVRTQLKKLEGNPGDVDTVVKLAQTEGLTKLTPDEQRTLLQLVGGTDKEISQPARQKLNDLLNDPKVKTSDPETFRQFLKEQPALNLPYFDIDKQSSELIEKYTSHGFWGADLDTDGLGKEVANLAKTEPDKAAALMDDVLKKIVGSDKDEVAQTFVESMSPEEVRAFASNDKGREILGQLKEHLLSGSIHGDEKAAASRISTAIKAADLEKSPEFKKLSPESQQAVLKLISKHEKDDEDVDNIIAFAKSKGFDTLPISTQNAMLDALDKRPKDKSFREALSNLTQKGNFTSLTTFQQTGVISDLSKFTTTLSYTWGRGGITTSDSDKAWLLDKIGDVSIYNAQHPDIVTVRNSLNHVLDGDIRVEVYSQASKNGYTSYGRRDGNTIRLNLHKDADRGVTEIVGTLVHEVNHAVNPGADNGTPEDFLTEFRAFYVGIEASGQTIDAQTLENVLDNLCYSPNASYSELRDLYLNSKEFKKVIDDAYAGLNENPPKLITPEEMRQKLLSAGFDTEYLKTPGNLDNH